MVYRGPGSGLAVRRGADGRLRWRAGHAWPRRRRRADRRGTAPLFAILGYLLHATARVARGRLRAVTGVVLAGVAAWTALSGLRLGGWTGLGSGGPPSAADVAAASRAAVRLDPAGRQVITIAVRGTAYLPGYVTARPGMPTTLVLVSRHVAWCSRGFVIASLGIQRILPAGGHTTIRLGRPAAGILRYRHVLRRDRLHFQHSPAARTAARRHRDT